jgi:SAM-dependent methyltransferase
VKDAWQELNERLIGSPDYFDLDARCRALSQTVGALAERYAHGRVLDAGAGRLTYRGLIAPHAKQYVSADLVAERPDLDVVCDLGAAPFREGAFDTILCIEVLEHTPTPGRVLRALRHALAADGTLIVTAPHIMYLHGEPHDYFRYTKYGLVSMLERAGFETTSVQGIGGLLAFVGSLCSDVGLAGASRIPALFRLAFAANRLFVRGVCWLERRLGDGAMVNSLFALGYAAVARKRPGPFEACDSF